MPSKKKAGPELFCAADLYAMKGLKVEKDLHLLIGGYKRHMPELPLVAGVHIEESPQIETRVVKHHAFDDRRIWQLATVWYKKKPVMVVQNGGREGDDFACRYVTDSYWFAEMRNHLAREIARMLKDNNRAAPAELVVELDHAAVATINEAMPIKELTFFQGWDFRDEFPKAKY